MREPIHLTNTSKRRRGPKQPLPSAGVINNDTIVMQESQYYTIDNTEDIYGTKLLPTQRCYVDPWDLENYDYVRSTPPRDYHNDTPSPTFLEDTSNTIYYNTLEKSEPPSKLNKSSRAFRSFTPTAQMECCRPALWPQLNNFNYFNQASYNDDGDNDNDSDYLMTMCPKPDYNVYTGCSANSHSTCSSETNMALVDYHCNRVKGHSLTSYEALKRRSSKFISPLPLEYPIPHMLTSGYDYCNLYSITLPCWSASECYECLSQIYKTQSLYNSITSAGESCNMTDCPLRRNVVEQRHSSLYSTIYGNKFGMSNKGLLQIDYSCSWNDLNRAMARNY